MNDISRARERQLEVMVDACQAVKDMSGDNLDYHLIRVSKEEPKLDDLQRADQAFAALAIAVANARSALRAEIHRIKCGEVR